MPPKKPKRKLTKTAKDPAHKSPKKAKSRKERAAEAVKDLVDASSSSMSTVDSLLADRSSRGRLRKVPVQRRSRIFSQLPVMYIPMTQQESSIYFKGAHIKYNM